MFTYCHMNYYEIELAQNLVSLRFINHVRHCGNGQRKAGDCFKGFFSAFNLLPRYTFPFTEKRLECVIHFALLLDDIVHEVLQIDVLVGGHERAGAIVLVYLAVAE